MRPASVILTFAVSVAAAFAQQSPAPDPEPRQVMRPEGNSSGWPSAEQQADGKYVLKAGTHIPLTVLTTVSSKNAAPGDRIYLQTMIPVSVDRRIVIPAGSYVNGTITQSQRPGKVKGKGELYLRFDSIMLSNGVTLDLLGRLGGMDGGNPGTLNRDEGKVTSDGSAGKDAMIVGGGAMGGAAMGNWIGGEGKDAGIGAGAGAAAGLAAVLLTRGPDAVVQRGSTLDMVLNRDLALTEDDLAGARASAVKPMGAPAPKQGGGNQRVPGMGRGVPVPIQ
jgi:hypothetical protein